MNLPIPSHLQAILIPAGENNTTYEVTGDIRCTCGCDTFRVNARSSRQIVTLFCTECGRQHLLFHAGKHGWDGFVCSGNVVFLEEDGPAEQAECAQCGSERFHVSVWISSQGPQDFLEECVAHDDSFTADDWVDGFEWITATLICAECGAKQHSWLDCETM